MNKIRKVILIFLASFAFFSYGAVYAAGQSPYDGIIFSEYDDMYPKDKEGSLQIYGSLGGLGAGYYFAYKDIAFTDAPDTMDIYYSIDAGRSTPVQIRLDSQNGEAIAEFTFSDGKGWEEKLRKTVKLSKELTRNHDIYVTVGGAVNLYSMNFNVRKIDKNLYSNDGVKLPFKDISENEREITLISGLGFMSGISEEEFAPAVPVTRAEFALSLYIMAGSPDFEITDKAFSDVDGDTAGAAAISYLKYKGITNGFGDGTFQPYNFITRQEAAYMTARFLGFDAVGSEEGMIGKTGLLNGTGDEKYLRRGKMAKLLYNAVTGKYVARDLEEGSIVYKEKEYILDKLSDIKYSKGLVCSVGEASIYGESNIGYNEILIDDDRYYIGSSDAASMLGMYAEFFYHEDDDGIKTLITLFPDKSNEENVFVSGGENELRSLSESELSYYIADREKSFRLNTKTSFIYNGRAVYGNISGLTDTKTFSGKIRYIKSQKADIVLIDEYKSIVIGGFDYENGCISDMVHGSKIDFDKDYISIYKNGELIDAKDVSEGDCAAVYQSKNNGEKFTKIILSDKRVSGRASAVDDKYIFIDGERYFKAAGFNSVSAGASGEFYFNAYDEAVWFRERTNADGIALMINALRFTDDDGENQLKLRMLCTDGNVYDMYSAEKIMIDGKRYTDIKTVGDSNIESAELINTPVRYKKNSDGKVTFIDTILTLSGNENDTMKKMNDDEKKFYYRPQGRIMKTGMSFEYPIKSDAAVFAVGKPENSSLYDAGLLSDFISYDTNPTGFVYKSSADGFVSDIFVWNDSECRSMNRFFMFDNLSEAVDSDNEPIYVLNGCIGNTKAVLYAGGVSGKYVPDIAEYVKSLRRGDVLVCGSDSDKNITYISTVRKADGTETVSGEHKALLTSTKNGPVYDPKNGDYIYLCGKITDKKDGYIEVAAGTVKQYIYYSGAELLKVSKKEILTKQSDKELFVGDNVLIYTYSAAAKIIIKYE